MSRFGSSSTGSPRRPITKSALLAFAGLSLVLVAFVGLSSLVLVGCFERNYLDPNACSPTILCSNGRTCVYGNCVVDVPDGFIIDMQGPPDDLTKSDAAGSCGSNDDCPSATTPICDATMHRCRGCTGMSDCGGKLSPLCAPSGACVVCLTKDDCAPSNQTCNVTTNLCTACSRNSECTTGACKSGSACASVSEIAYVDHQSCSGSEMGTKAMPYCEIQSAVMSSGKEYIVVAGYSGTYMPVSVTAGSFSIVGPGRSATPLATVGSTSAPAFSVTTSSTAASLTVDGFDTATTTADSMFCSAAASAVTSLTILNSNIHGAIGAGVNSSKCTLVLDSDIISANAGGGVKMATTSYTILNNFIVNNGSTGRGVTMDDTSTGTFSFNTVAKNLVGAGVGGIECGAGATKSITNSIFDGNSMSGGTQFGAKCSVTNVVTTGGDSAGTPGMPVYVSGTDFHLQANNSSNMTCCVDVVHSSTDDHDIDGSSRPKGAGFDIGAHEVQ